VIITNYHVIEGAHNALIKLKNGEVYDRVWVIDYHPRRDVAVLKIQGIGLPTVAIGDSATVEQGDWCVAIGNPKGLEHTVSDGLISAIRILEGNQMFQISTPISAGSSGGPLYNKNGEVIGITTAGLVGEGVQNLNFAVPLKYAMPMLESTQRMTLAEVTAQEVPAGAGAEQSLTARRATYTDPSGIATIDVEPGWEAGPPTVEGALMSVTKDASNFQIMLIAGYKDVAGLFDIGKGSAKGSLKKFKADTDVIRQDIGGIPVMIQVFRGELKKVKMHAFVGAMITPKGGFLGMAFMPGATPKDLEDVTRIFLSLR
jgi:S1-C subfamily serine protease